MKRSLVLLALSLIAVPMFGEVTGRYLVMTRPAARHHQITLLQSDSTGVDHAAREFENIPAFAATLTAAEVATLRRSPDVVYVSPVVERHLLGVEPKSFVPSASSIYQREQVVPYGIDMVRARDTWFATRGQNVNVVIVDTGIDFHHPELIAAYRGGYNAIARNSNNFDDNHHGTHVAGTIAAADNTIGVVGVAPNTNVWSVKALDQDGNGTDESLITSIDWILSKKQEVGGRWIMSLSLGSRYSSPVEEDAFRRALAAGILIVAAAGNSAFPLVDYPANYPGVFAIGAIDNQEQLAGFSNRGPRIDVVAPGVAVPSTIPLGTGTVSEVVVGGTASYGATPLNGSPKGLADAPVVFCGIGQPQEFPESVRDNIAFIRRGELLFNEKVRNAKAAGARAVIIAARETDPEDRSAWTLIRPCDVTCDDNTADKEFDWPLTLAVTYADGEKVRGASGMVQEAYQSDDYALLSGTSMATPHVSGVAALLWSLAPQLSADDIKYVMQGTAKDLGTPGFDAFFGFGLVDALAAAKKIAPTVFGLPEPPPPPTAGPRRRATH